MQSRNFGQITNFDPILIISQITLTSSFFYTLFVFFTIIFNSVFGLKIHIDQILNSDAYCFDSKYGLVTLCSYFFTNIIMIVIYIFAIEKANKILDYVMTNFFFYLVLTTLNSKFPVNFWWWVINLVSLAVVTLISEYLCLKIEQKEIHLEFSSLENKPINRV